MNKAIETIMNAYEEGNNCIICYGNSLLDIFSNQNGNIITIQEGLRQEFFRKHKIVLLTFSSSDGLRYYYEDVITSLKDKQSIKEILGATGLNESPPAMNVSSFYIPRIKNLLTLPGEFFYENGNPIRFACLIRHTHDWLPHYDPGMISDEEQSKCKQIMIDLAQSIMLRRKQNVLILECKKGFINRELERFFYKIDIPYPDREEKKQFLKAACNIYKNAKFSSNMTQEHISNLISGTPNLSIEALLRGSHNNGKIISTDLLRKAKEEDVLGMSENTLRLMNDEIDENSLVGEYIKPAFNFIKLLAEGLKVSDPNTARAIVLVGPPGNGKTQLAKICSKIAGVPAFELLSTKAPTVGEPERLSRLQQDILKNFYPNIGFIDEITEAFPMERSDFDGDSGASKAMFASFLTYLADPTSKGKNLLTATTNCPWRISDAMRTRITFVPVFHPCFPDFVIITTKICEKKFENFNISNEEIFKNKIKDIYLKGAVPRDIIKMIDNIIIKRGRNFEESYFYEAADNLICNNWNSIVYADLWALKVCSDASFLPWIQNENYPMPVYFEGIIKDRKNIDTLALEKKILELKPYVNI